MGARGHPGPYLQFWPSPRRQPKPWLLGETAITGRGVEGSAFTAGHFLSPAYLFLKQLYSSLVHVARYVSQRKPPQSPQPCTL